MIIKMPIEGTSFNKHFVALRTRCGRKRSLLLVTTIRWMMEQGRKAHFHMAQVDGLRILFFVRRRRSSRGRSFIGKVQRDVILLHLIIYVVRLGAVRALGRLRLAACDVRK